MSSDPTEPIRRDLVAKINSLVVERAALEERVGGRVWDIDELRADFNVIGFAAPFVVAVKKDTGEKGGLFFQHNPRYYWGWKSDSDS